MTGTQAAGWMPGHRKRPFWKRCNRGFLVSMVLLAAVVVYVTVTQLMLLPERQELTQLCEQVQTIWEESTLLSDERAAALSDSPEQQDVLRAGLTQQLQGYFLEGSDYIGSGAALLFDAVAEEFPGGQRTMARTPIRRYIQQCNIQEDVATITLCADYSVDGFYYDYYADDNHLTEYAELEQSLYLTLVCKQVDDSWKIFRIEELYSSVWPDAVKAVTP